MSAKREFSDLFRAMDLLESQIANIDPDGVWPVGWARIAEIEEFTDIQWAAVQSLMNWASETGEPFQKCLDKFLQGFQAEITNLKEQGFPERGGGFYSLTFASLFEEHETLEAGAAGDEEKKKPPYPSAPPNNAPNTPLRAAAAIKGRARRGRVAGRLLVN